MCGWNSARTDADVAAMSTQRARYDIAEARALLDTLADVAPTMAARAVPRLAQRAGELRETLDRVEQDPEAPTGDERARMIDAASVYALEVLAVYQGALLRQADIDRSLCAIGERLLDEVATGHPDWRGLPVILGAADALVPESGVIRLRFPAESIWALPLLAHEQGHYVAFSLTRDEGAGLHRGVRHPVLDLMDEDEQLFADVSARSHLVELFADVYASWVTGPSYLAALTSLRLDPASAGSSTMQHPAPDARVRAALMTLERMDELGGPVSRPFAAARERLASAWTAATAAAPPLWSATGNRDFDTVQRRAGELIALCERYCADTRFDSRRAEALCADLRDGTGHPIRPDDRVLDVVAAAWRVRYGTTSPGAVETIGSRAVTACKDVLTANGVDRKAAGLG